MELKSTNMNRLLIISFNYNQNSNGYNINEIVKGNTRKNNKLFETNNYFMNDTDWQSIKYIKFD